MLSLGRDDVVSTRVSVDCRLLKMQHANHVANLINRFHIPGWKNVSAADIIVEPLGQGYINRTSRIYRVTSSDEHVDVRGPESLVLKQYGGNKFAEHLKTSVHINCASTQLLISYELSRRGWGPKLYGSFENGRIEEYVDCHTLRPAEAFSDEVSADLAITMARFHSLDLPLVRNRVDFLRTMKLSFDREREPLSEWVRTFDASSECLEAFKLLLDFPSDQEYNWINSMVNKIKHRQVLASGDPNYLNRLVKNTKAITSDGTRCMMIDFDFTGYYDRGLDLGGHFLFGTIGNEIGECSSTGPHYPSRDERDRFLRRYLEESSRLFADFDPDNVDNINHLHVEADIYATLYCLWVIFVSAGFYKMYQVEPNKYTMISGLVKRYFSLKQDFCATHSVLSHDGVIRDS